MLTVVERLHPGALLTLREDPLAELQSWPEIQVSLVPDSGDGGRCSVTDSYQDHTQPPTLAVGMSRSLRRRGFTGLHELGHHLQQTDLVLAQHLFTYQDSEAFEEAACDAFAARVLLPDDEMMSRISPADRPQRMSSKYSRDSRHLGKHAVCGPLSISWVPAWWCCLM
jgi:Zn-dependent peptidase ImmA (M78 family)